MNRSQIQIRIVSPMEKVLLFREPSREGGTSRLTAFCGETVSFQIAYRWLKPEKRRGRVRMTFPDNLHVRIRMVESVPCLFPAPPESDSNYLGKDPGLYPDLLRDLDPEAGFPLTYGLWQSLWVDIYSNLPHSRYYGEIILEEMPVPGGDKGRELRTIPVSVNILDIPLPRLGICFTEWLHCDCLAQYYGVEAFSERHWQLMENFVRCAAEHNHNTILTPVFTPPLDTAIGRERMTIQLVDVKKLPNGYEFSYDKFERWVAMCQRCGIEYFEISHLFTQWGAAAAPKIMAETDKGLQQIFGWKTNAAGRKYPGFLRAFLTSFLSELDKLGIRDKCLFHISDEPGPANAEAYRAARNKVKDALKGCRIIDALSDHELYEQGLVEEPVVSTDHVEPFLKNRPEKLWVYYCCAQAKDVSNRFIAMPGSRTRILGVQLYKFNMDGFLQWGFNFYNSELSLFPVDPFRTTDGEGSFPSGDPFIVYPGPDGKPLESQRLMLLDEAMNDYRALKALENLTDRETALQCIETKDSGEITFSSYPMGPSYLTGVRRRVHRALFKILDLDW